MLQLGGTLGHQLFQVLLVLLERHLGPLALSDLLLQLSGTLIHHVLQLLLVFMQSSLCPPASRNIPQPDHAPQPTPSVVLQRRDAQKVVVGAATGLKSQLIFGALLLAVGLKQLGPVCEELLGRLANLPAFTHPQQAAGSRVEIHQAVFGIQHQQGIGHALDQQAVGHRDDLKQAVGIEHQRQQNIADRKGKGRDIALAQESEIHQSRDGADQRNSHAQRDQNSAPAVDGGRAP